MEGGKEMSDLTSPPNAEEQRRIKLASDVELLYWGTIAAGVVLLGAGFFLLSLKELANLAWIIISLAMPCLVVVQEFLIPYLIRRRFDKNGRK